VEAVTEAKKLEAENAHQWKQTKHLLKYIKNQEKDIGRNERCVCYSLPCEWSFHIFVLCLMATHTLA